MDLGEVTERIVCAAAIAFYVVGAAILIVGMLFDGRGKP